MSLKHYLNILSIALLIGNKILFLFSVCKRVVINQKTYSSYQLQECYFIKYCIEGNNGFLILFELSLTMEEHSRKNENIYGTTVSI